MAATATAHPYSPEQYEEVKRTYGSLRPSTDWLAMDYATSIEKENVSVDSIIKQIIDVINDPEQYAEGESAPSQAAITIAKTLLESVAIPKLVRPEISVYYGELDVTWRSNGRLVRLILFPDSRSPEIYYHVDSEAVLTRGHSCEATAESLSERLQWLSTES